MFQQGKEALTIVFDIESLLINVTGLDDAFTHHTQLHHRIIEIAGVGVFLVAPGALALMRYVFNQPGLRVIFVSDAALQKNQDKVESLLMNTLGRAGCDQAMQSSLVMTEAQLLEAIQQSREWDRHRQKRLRKKGRQASSHLEPNPLPLNALIFIDNTGQPFLPYDINLKIKAPALSNPVLERVMRSVLKGSEASVSVRDIQSVCGLFYIAGILAVCVELYFANEPLDMFLKQLREKSTYWEYSSFKAFADFGVACLTEQYQAQKRSPAYSVKAALSITDVPQLTINLDSQRLRLARFHDRKHADEVAIFSYHLLRMHPALDLKIQGDHTEPPLIEVSPLPQTPSVIANQSKTSLQQFKNDLASAVAATTMKASHPSVNVLTVFKALNKTQPLHSRVQHPSRHKRR